MATATGNSLGSRYPVIKVVIFVLLTCNTAYYLAVGTVSEAVDTIAWFALLVLFQLETGFGGPHRVRTHAIRAARLVAATAVGAALIGYFNDQAWLDVANTALWIAVVILLEFEMRYPHVTARHRVGFPATAVVLYGALAALIPVWAWQGEWFDAYDALLWLMAFALIEMDVLGISRPIAGIQRV